MERVGTNSLHLFKDERILILLFLSHLLLLLLLGECASEVEGKRRRNEYGSVCSDCDTYQQGENEALDGRASEDENGQQHHQCGQ